MNRLNKQSCVSAASLIRAAEVIGGPPIRQPEAALSPTHHSFWCCICAPLLGNTNLPTTREVVEMRRAKNDLIIARTPI